MTNVGTALLLASVLFFFERNFVGRVRRATSEAADIAVRGAVNEFRESTQRLNTRIDDLQTKARARVTEDAAEQDAKIARLDDDLSFDTLTAALEEAHDLRAFKDDGVTVSFGPRPEDVRFIVSWLQYVSHQDYGDSRRLSFTYLPFRNPDPTSRVALSVDVAWEPDMSAEDFGSALVRAMQREGYGAEAKALDLSRLFGLVRDAIAVAVASRRADPGGWLAGALIELSDSRWAVTNQGLEHREHGIVIAAEAFPEPEHKKAPAAAPIPAPEAPEWAEPREWAAAYGLAAKRLPDRWPAALYAQRRYHAAPLRAARER